MNESPNHALQRTATLAFSFRCAAVSSTGSVTACAPAAKPRTCRAFALRRRAHTRALRSRSLSLGSFGPISHPKRKTSKIMNITRITLTLLLLFVSQSLYADGRLLGWRCNYKNHLHKTKSECAHPEFGGESVYEAEDPSVVARLAKSDAVKRVVSLINKELGITAGFITNAKETADGTVTGKFKVIIQGAEAAEERRDAAKTVTDKLRDDARASAESSRIEPSSKGAQEKADYDRKLVAVAEEAYMQAERDYNTAKRKADEAERLREKYSKER